MEDGKTYLVHTHLGLWLGRVRSQTMDDVVLDQCSWVASQGRMGANVTAGTWDSNSESEFVGDGVIVPKSGTIRVPWLHALPTTTR